MKKSLIALAALATIATAAQAQSTVTVYGIVDMGIMQSKTQDSAGSQLAAVSGPLSTSRFGLRGTEDLGGGLKASFNLESELTANTGAAGGTQVTNGTTTSGVLFSRASNVTLSDDSLGSIQLGRMNRLEYDALGVNDAFGGANFGGIQRVAYISGTVIPNADARYANAVVLRAPKFAGLSLAYQHEFGGQAGDDGKSSADSVAVDYTYGNLRAIATYSNNRNSVGGKQDEVTTLGANYNFGFAQVYVGTMQRETAKDTDKIRADYLGVKVPVNAKVTAMALYTKVGNYNAVENADANIYSVGATYAFSKRTTAYVMHGKSSNDPNAKVYISNLAQTAVAGKDQTATTFGIRHAF